MQTQYNLPNMSQYIRILLTVSTLQSSHIQRRRLPSPDTLAPTVPDEKAPERTWHELPILGTIEGINTRPVYNI